jgi:transcriptional regulator with XRE-family HTH domain
MTRGKADMKSGIGQRMRELRRGMTQAGFAERVGVAQGQVAKYERGMMPGPVVLLNISRVMGVSIEWILCGEEGPASMKQALHEHSPSAVVTGTVKAMRDQVREMRDAAESAPPRELGMQAERKIEDADQADFAAGHIMDTKLPRYEAGLLGDLVRDAVRDREIRQKVLDFYSFLRFQKDKAGADDETSS